MTAHIAHSIRLSPALVADMAILARNPRPDEAEQMAAMCGWSEYDPEAAAQRLVGSINATTWALSGPDGLPFYAGGFLLVRPGVLECWAIGTPEGWARHWRAISKHTKRAIGEALQHAHRIETVALASRTAAHDWYDWLGLGSEGVRVGHFANGADGIGFAITRRAG